MSNDRWIVVFVAVSVVSLLLTLAIALRLRRLDERSSDDEQRQA